MKVIAELNSREIVEALCEYVERKHGFTKAAVEHVGFKEGSSPMARLTAEVGAPKIPKRKKSQGDSQ